MLQTKRVAEILAGRALSESEWNETVAALQEAEDAFGAAIEEKGAAAKALAVIRDHHKRFNEIEAELKNGRCISTGWTSCKLCLKAIPSSNFS